MLESVVIVYGAVASVYALVATIIWRRRSAACEALQRRLDAMPPAADIRLARALATGEISVSDLEEAGVAVHKPLPPSIEEINAALTWLDDVEVWLLRILEDPDVVLKWETNRAVAPLIAMAPRMIDSRCVDPWAMGFQGRMRLPQDAGIVWTGDSQEERFKTVVLSGSEPNPWRITLWPSGPV